MQDDVKNEVPNGTPKILIPFDGVLNMDRVSKSGGRLEGDHATHFKHVKYKDLPHGVWFGNVHMQTIQLKGAMI
jgi:hypothetical protein